jgi:hypothetical protein
MRAPSLCVASFCLLVAGSGASFAESTDTLKYYAATTPSGALDPRPDPWCELTDFGQTSLWACPSLAEWRAFNVREGGSRDSEGGTSAGGGMDGGGGGGMDD